MSLPVFMSFSKLKRSLTGKPVFSRNPRLARQPGDILPNFKASSTCGQIDFWDWAEGYWVYIFELRGCYNSCASDLLSYALASAALSGSRIKVVGISRLPQAQLDELSSDLCAIAGKNLRALLVSDEAGSLIEGMGLQTVDDGASKPTFRTLLLDRDLRIKTIWSSTVPSILTAYDTMQLVKTIDAKKAAVTFPSTTHDQSKRAHFELVADF